MDLNYSTYFMAVNYLDVYLSRGVTPADQLQLLRLACLSLAIKINEIRDVTMPVSVDLTDMMIKVTQELDYNLYRLTEYHAWYLTVQSLPVDLDPNIRRQSFQLCHLVAIDLESRQYQPDQLAKAILLHCDSSLPIDDEGLEAVKVYVSKIEAD